MSLRRVYNHPSQSARTLGCNATLRHFMSRTQDTRCGAALIFSHRRFKVPAANGACPSTSVSETPVLFTLNLHRRIDKAEYNR